MSLSLEQQTRLNSICPYFTRFPLAFPLACLSGAIAGQWVLDPFCGSGTSVFAARVKGACAVGVDSSPVAAAIARAKLQHVAPAAVIDRAACILRHSSATQVPEGPFWDNCYTPSVLETLCRFRNYFISTESDSVDMFLRALLMGLLHGPIRDKTLRYFSNHLTADFAPLPEAAIAVWKEHHLQPPVCNVREMIQQRAAYLLAEQPEPAVGIVLGGDSRKVHFADRGQKFGWIISSPPYYGMDSYPTDQWLRNWIIGGTAFPERKAAGQIAQQTPDAYVNDLAEVWKHVGDACHPGARLIVRVGDVPSIKAPPAVELFEASLNRAAAGWKIEKSIAVHRDTVTQNSDLLFSAPAPWPKNEMEVFARLKL